MSKKSSNILEPIAIGVAGVVSAGTISYWQKLTSSAIIVVIFTGVSSIVVNEVILFLFNKLPKRFAWSRKLVDKKAAYEGFYLEIKNVNNIRTYAVVCLNYCVQTDDYQLSGTAVEQDGRISINWKSNFVKIDTATQQIIYSQTGHFTHTSDGKIFDGVTYMNFNYFLNKNLMAGIGHYIDTIPAKSDFLFFKISKKDCKELLNKDTIEKISDYGIFVKRYHETKAELIFSWEHKL
ncbi:MAG TPA: hypothetical protein VF421_20215 [Niabella sp.]